MTDDRLSAAYATVREAEDEIGAAMRACVDAGTEVEQICADQRLLGARDARERAYIELG